MSTVAWLPLLYGIAFRPSHANRAAALRSSSHAAADRKRFSSASIKVLTTTSVAKTELCKITPHILREAFKHFTSIANYIILDFNIYM